jgi:hypothetical protein
MPDLMFLIGKDGEGASIASRLSVLTVVTFTGSP